MLVINKQSVNIQREYILSLKYSIKCVNYSHPSQDEYMCTALWLFVVFYVV